MSQSSTLTKRGHKNGKTNTTKPIAGDSADRDKLSKDPEFSMKDLRAVIPAELFKRSYTKSFGWLLHDIILVAIMYYIAWNYLNKDYIPFVTLRIALWLLWWYVQGAFMTGIWVIAHECGHHGFTPNKLVNNIVGFICHTMLLVPYFSWQYTHWQHHSKTNNLELDTVHQPRMHKAASSSADVKPRNRGPLDRLWRIFKLSVLGWPLYLIMDATGPPKHDELSWVNHFNPYCNYFPQWMVNLVLLSDIGLIAWIWCLYRIYKIIGLVNIIFYYFIPYLIVNHWLVTITFLQHTDWDIDRYTPCEWTWLRGAFGTIDRDYGIFLNYAHHHIQDSHVVHHLFSSMPHYNAIKATKYLKESKIFGKYYMESKETWYGALWTIVGQGRWTKKDENTIVIKK